MLPDGEAGSGVGLPVLGIPRKPGRHHLKFNAMGAGLGLQLKHSDRVSVAFFGDGASNEGTFHESMNMAAVWKLPVIFICENNQYGISTNVSKSTACERIASRAKGYDIPGYSLDGNDAIGIYEKMGEILDYVRGGNGPVLLEMVTYRMTGHYFGDSQNYREKSEVEEWKEKDPIDRLEKALIEDYGISEEDIEAIKKRQKEEVLEACDRALEDPEPMVDDLTEDMFDPTMADIKWVKFEKQNARKF